MSTGSSNSTGWVLCELNPGTVSDIIVDWTLAVSQIQTFRDNLGQSTVTVFYGPGNDGDQNQWPGEHMAEICTHVKVLSLSLFIWLSHSGIFYRYLDWPLVSLLSQVFPLSLMNLFQTLMQLFDLIWIILFWLVPVEVGCFYDTKPLPAVVFGEYLRRFRVHKFEKCV